MRPANPDPSPVALEEQLELGIASVTCVEKLVQPLNCVYVRGIGVKVSWYLLIELTTIVCS